MAVLVTTLSANGVRKVKCIKPINCAQPSEATATLAHRPTTGQSVGRPTISRSDAVLSHARDTTLSFGQCSVTHTYNTGRKW